MNSTVPNWWLIVSAVFFIVNIAFFVVLCFVLLRVLTLLKELSPKIHSLTTKVESVATRVEEVAASVKNTMEGVGGRAKSVAGSVDLIAHSASKQFERFSPLIVGVLTSLRLLKAVQEYRRGKSVAAATTQAATEPKKTVSEQRKVDRKLAKQDNK